DSSAPSVYTITGTTGQIVLNGALEPVNNIIKVNNLHTGVYIFKISDGKTSCNKKLIINR
ncbi:MAG: T9SS type A sorting domain-containing protein, partial [Bacteroidetes bacterium]|nr:T9SS type A sorting domain-containing protein [Bacteroidota bacterium]